MQKSATFNVQFPRKIQHIWQLIRLTPRTNISHGYDVILKWCLNEWLYIVPSFPSTVMQKTRDFIWPSPEKMFKNPFFDTKSPLMFRLRFFSKFRPYHIFYFYIPSNFMQSLKKDGLTDQRTRAIIEDPIGYIRVQKWPGSKKVDDRRSLCIFGGVTWLSSHFTTRSVFSVK